MASSLNHVSQWLVAYHPHAMFLMSSITLLPLTLTAIFSGLQQKFREMVLAASVDSEFGAQNKETVTFENKMGIDGVDVNAICGESSSNTENQVEKTSMAKFAKVGS